MGRATREARENMVRWMDIGIDSPTKTPPLFRTRTPHFSDDYPQLQYDEHKHLLTIAVFQLIGLAVVDGKQRRRMFRRSSTRRCILDN